MSQSVLTILGLAGATALLRASGPMLLGQRRLPAWSIPVLDALPIALMVAMIMVYSFSEGDRVMVDERLAGLAVAAGVILVSRKRMVGSVLAAAVAVALLRLVT